MRLAINYSHQATQLVQAGQIEIDFFKTPNWDWLISEAIKLRPVAVHYTLEAGNNELSQVDWSQVERIAQKTGTPFISLHLDSRQSCFPGLSVDSLDKSDIRQVYKVLLSDVMLVVERFGADRVIIENSPYRAEAGKTLRLCVEPEIITRIVEETGCGLLLDISHAVITSSHIGINPADYLEQLPVNNLKELHFAGIHRNKGRWMDHLSILKRDWQWLDCVLSRIHSGDWRAPWLLAFEYGGVGPDFEKRSDPEVMLKQVPMLLERVRASNSRSEP